MLEGVLNKEQIQRMLKSPNMEDKLPLHVIASSAEEPLLDWMLDQFTDPMERFLMMAKRNKYGDEMWDKYGATKNLQDFFGEKIIGMLKVIDFGALKSAGIEIKECFRRTMIWKQPAIQQLILKKVDKSEHHQLLTSEGLNLKRSILNDLVDIDSVGIGNVVLSALKNQAMFLVTDSEKGRNPLHTALAHARGYSVMGPIFEAIWVRSSLSCRAFFSGNASD